MTRRLYLALFLLSTATLTFELHLSRLFSVAQFYHFAFLIVSIALLGFGASGTALAVFPTLTHTSRPHHRLGMLSLMAGLAISTSYLLTNWLPFDSFSIAWDRRQIAVLVIHYLALALPFFISGMAVGWLLSAFPEAAGRTYAANLIGSATGGALALLTPSVVGGEGVVLLSSLLAGLAALLSTDLRRPSRMTLLAGLLCLTLLALLVGRALGLPVRFLDLRLSPYKGLSYALRYPDARLIFSRWNAFSRVDRVRSTSIHSLPGLSFRYLAPLPSVDALFVDGDNLSQILSPDADPSFADYLPLALAHRLRPSAEVLILEPRGGLDVFTSLALGAQRVIAVEMNPLIVEAAQPLYRHPRLRVILESDRSYLRRTPERYDLIVLSLTESYHPIRSGAYSLSEDYRYTVEAFTDALHRLRPDGLLVVSRWLQDPPSEELRAFALALTALEATGGDPRAQIIAFRGYQLATLIVSNRPFSDQELAQVRDFLARCAFDPIYLPDIRPEETNRYSVLPQSIYYQTFVSLLETQPRQRFYHDYPYQVQPPTDNHPFFGHYFKWQQAPQVWAELGQTWQPFGGAGYFVVLALLLLALILAGVILLLPLWLRRPSAATPPARPLTYFSLIGLAFLLVEIPLIQRFILYLGNPAYAFTAVLFTLLFFSGWGSRLSHRLSLRWTLPALVIVALLLPLLLPHLFQTTLGLPLALRLAITVAVLAPLGFLMGLPFPAGLRWLHENYASSASSASSSVPLVWAANGAASVISSILAALLALTFGFQAVLVTGALCYAAAWLVMESPLPRRPFRSPRPSR